MGSIIAKENLRVGLKAKDWTDAIRLSGAVLEEAGSIVHACTENPMVKAVEDLRALYRHYARLCPSLTPPLPPLYIKKTWPWSHWRSLYPLAAPTILSV